MTTLYVIATPIGNVQDFSLRALATLEKIDLIIAEDTRITQKLCAHFAIEAPIISLHEHTTPHELRTIIDTVVKKECVALMCDAGTPVIADPGTPLIQELLKQKANVHIVPIPGPSAVIAALSISGLWGNQFVFLGFAPQKKGRNAFFKTVEESSMTVVFFEAPHRMKKTQEALHSFKNQTRKMVIGRELTKQFETIYYTTIADALTVIPAKELKGEFVIVVEGQKK